MWSTSRGRFKAIADFNCDGDLTKKNYHNTKSLPSQKKTLAEDKDNIYFVHPNCEN